MCGENRDTPLVFGTPVGSPPHVRGKLDGMGVVDLSVGITPACAGKTEPQVVLAAGGRDHPRMCGENQVNQMIGSWK